MDCYEATSLKGTKTQRQQEERSIQESCIKLTQNIDESRIDSNAKTSGINGIHLSSDWDNSINLQGSLPIATTTTTAAEAPVKLRKHSEQRLVSLEGATDSCSGGGYSQSYRISMANLEGTHESELDQILGELSFLEEQMTNLQLRSAQNLTLSSDTKVINNRDDAMHNTYAILPATVAAKPTLPGPPSSTSATSSSPRTHSRTNSTISGATTLSSCETSSSCSSSGFSENGCQLSYNRSHTGYAPNVMNHVNGQQQQTQHLQQQQQQQQQQALVKSHGIGEPEVRTESPDNDSAFSDTVSLLSCESSASSVSAAMYQKQKELQTKLQQQQQQVLHMQYAQQCTTTYSGNEQNSKEAKIRLALQKLENAPVRRLFVKAFTSDGASKSLLVDEYMTCGQVTRLLAGKNHVQMQPNWVLVESLGDLQMERIFEDHELLVDNLMAWNSDGNNRVLFQQRDEKYALFSKPEIYFPGPQMAPGCQHDENTRAMLVEDFYKSNSQLQVEGPLYFKSDPKKGWKRYHFVLRNSGLYYFPKEKTKNVRDLVCLTQFKRQNIYSGLGWKKKWKSPTDYTFSFKSEQESSMEKACRSLKMLCAEDQMSLQKWITAVRISKYGIDLWHNYKNLLKDLCLVDGQNKSNYTSYIAVRSNSINSIASAVPSQCGSISSAISSLSNQSKERISRGSSSSSSGFLSDDNNAFDSEYTTGTIKRKPSMKPNLPLTTITRQLKEVGEITICQNEPKLIAGDGGKSTLICRRNRRKSLDSNGSNTLKRCHAVSAHTTNTTASTADRKSVDAVKDLSDNLCLTPTDMNASTLSLDSLPPPPPPPPLELDQDIYGSHASLPPPPLPEEATPFIIGESTSSSLLHGVMMSAASNAIQSNLEATTNPIKLAPPYKSPPHYAYPVNEGKPSIALAESANSVPIVPQTLNTTQKKVSFANPPVLLSNRMCSPERVTNNDKNYRYSNNNNTNINSNGSNNLPLIAPKNLKDSAANPPREFLKDLQRVMRRKWQVAQKCKLEPATTPHEVLGFRDFNNDDLLAAHNLYSGDNSSHYYRETANVSNWVEEHYGAGGIVAPNVPSSSSLSLATATVGAPAAVAAAATSIITPSLTTMGGGDFALYENLHANRNLHNLDSSDVPSLALPLPPPPVQLRKKRPPPPPPKRSDSTHLTTHRV